MTTLEQAEKKARERITALVGAKSVFRLPGAAILGIAANEILVLDLAQLFRLEPSRVKEVAREIEDGKEFEMQKTMKNIFSIADEFTGPVMQINPFMINPVKWLKVGTTANYTLTVGFKLVERLSEESPLRGQQ